MKPLIGITAGTIQTEEKAGANYKYGQGHTYVDVIRLAGGVPVLIPVALSAQETREVCERLDGILFSGGNDITPGVYNKEPTYARNLDTPRDTHEVELMNLALAANTPVLAICRGMQLLNVVRGGTLYQDIMEEIPTAMNHDGHHKDVTEPLLHTLTIEPGSHLSSVLGSVRVNANSFHHQAVKDLGSGLIVNARSEDGVIEGIEDMTRGYVMGVQAHPESLATHGDEQWRRLFESFVRASINTRQQHADVTITSEIAQSF